MDEKTKSEEPTPEQLVKLLEAQMVASRSRRVEQGSHRRTVGTLALFIIVFGAAFALWFLLHLLEDMRPPKDGEQAPPGETSR